MLVGVSVLAATGCSSLPLPAETAGITLVPVASAALEIHRPKFRMRGGSLQLEGYVFRQHRADTTADSHIDLVCLDAVGNILRVDTTSFSPRSLPRTLRMPQPHAFFVVTDPQIPRGTIVIEVRGHDGAHEHPGP
jgi:hypothetical protein